jgi:nitrite reductase (NADH) large subunit
VSEPLVIDGNGMAAARLVDEMTRCALARHTIAVIGDEPRLAYNRVRLSLVLTGETAPEDIELKPMSWWRSGRYVDGWLPGNRDRCWPP